MGIRTLQIDVKALSTQGTIATPQIIQSSSFTKLTGISIAALNDSVNRALETNKNRGVSW